MCRIVKSSHGIFTIFREKKEIWLPKSGIWTLWALIILVQMAPFKRAVRRLKQPRFALVSTGISLTEFRGFDTVAADPFYYQIVHGEIKGNEHETKCSFI